MKRDLLQELTKGILLADGAMGTQIYAQGVSLSRSYDELSVSNPDLIRSIHQSYVDAGARLLETNTFTANRAALAAFGFEKRVHEINCAAAKLAREVAGETVFVAGSVGPLSWVKKDAGMLSDDETRDFFAEQIAALTEGGVDAIVLETFTHLQELKVAIATAKKISSLPLICHVSLKYAGEGEFEGIAPADAAKKIESWGADVIGVNCSDGPQGVYEAIRQMSSVTTRPLSAMPNAGLPQLVQGRLFYMATPEYFADFARKIAQAGAVLIGGCCGTTPDHIRRMRQHLRSVEAMQKVVRARAHVSDLSVASISSDEPPPLLPEKKSPFGALLGKKFAVSVEIEPPASTSPQKMLEGAKLLKDFGVDAINISDGPRAMARMSALATALLIRDRIGVETIIHYCCRDRNILGMQMDLLGASALGMHNLMLITGDPPRMGNYPEATAVFDIDSIGLIRFAANLNRGLDFALRPIKGRTQFLIGTGVNPGAVDLGLEVERYARKVDAGAEFVFAQPGYDPKLLETFLKRVQHVKRIPFFVGVLPLASLRNAEFLHNEVPGMQVPKVVMERMAAAASQEAQRDVGLAVAREMLLAARALKEVSGVYVFPPFRKYEAVGELLSVLR